MTGHFTSYETRTNHELATAPSGALAQAHLLMFPMRSCAKERRRRMRDIRRRG
jgi:hypothetical protein